MYIIIIFLFFLFQSFKVFSNFIKVQYILMRLSIYKDVCEYMLDDPETTEYKKDLLNTEISSMDRSIDIINSTLKSNPFRLLREIHHQNKFDKGLRHIQEDFKK